MSEFKEKKDKELQEELIESKESLRKFRFRSSGTRVTNIRGGRNTRRKIARILTELKAREEK